MLRCVWVDGCGWPSACSTGVCTRVCVCVRMYNWMYVSMCVCECVIYKGHWCTREIHAFTRTRPRPHKYTQVFQSRCPLEPGRWPPCRRAARLEWWARHPRSSDLRVQSQQVSKRFHIETNLTAGPHLSLPPSLPPPLPTSVQFDNMQFISPPPQLY